jgi:alpha-glucoside transport system substrate-binding protein
MKQRLLTVVSCALLASSSAQAQKVVNIFGAFSGNDAKSFQAVIDAFEAKNPGIQIKYSSSADFNTVLNVRVQGGDYPDLAAIPQPGVVNDLAVKGAIVPVPTSVLVRIKRNYSPAWEELGKADDGKVYGVFHRVNVKGLVFYNKAAFAKAGYAAPKSWVELQGLSKKMEASGTAPWCVGIESGAATGWAATDWLENFMLRTQPTSVYDNWITGKLPFTSPEVKNAFTLVDSIWNNPKAVYGGRASIAATNFQPSAQGLFTSAPQCWMHLQGSFATDFFQDSVKKDLDGNVGVFVLPMINTKLPQTLEVGGDQFVVFKGKVRPEVTRFLEFLTTADSAAPWAKLGGGIFPQKGQDLSSYKTKIEREFAAIILSAKAARFDASDAMPSAVNQAFWKGTADWTTGTPLDQVLGEIAAAYKK